MPWTDTTTMDQRLEFVTLASAPDANMSALCRRFGISRSVGYKWLARWTREGPEGLHDRSRRPQTSPRRTPAPVEAAVCAVRRAHPAWGGRKIRAVLLRQLQGGSGPVSALLLAALTPETVPAASTCTRILDRHGHLVPPEERPATAWTRFEKTRPNQLWQMDFKGDVALQDGQRCYPLTVVDDHSRYAVVLAACLDQKRETVQERLITAFRRYGRPERIITDHGPPWGVGMVRSDTHGPGSRPGPRSYYTVFSAWLMRLGIQVSFTARAHPQTNGKNERFNQTLGVEVMTPGQQAAPGSGPLVDVHRCQAHFDAWRQTYNAERPHEALGLAVPADRYRLSTRTMPDCLPKVTYGPGDAVRRVDTSGRICFQGQRYRVGKAFAGEAVAVRPRREGPATHPVFWDVYFAQQRIRTLPQTTDIDDLNASNV